MKVFSDIALAPTPSAFNLAPLDACQKTFFYPNKLTIIFIDSGHANVTLERHALSIQGPGVICLNETEHLTILRSCQLKGKILCFSPSSVRDYFTFENIRSLAHSFSPNDIQLVLSLSIFFQRFSYYTGFIPVSEPQLKQLDKLLEQLVSEQDFKLAASDTLTQIIKIIKRLVQVNMSLSKVITTHTDLEIKDVLLYLHTHCSEKITIPALSRQFHINRTTLSDRFFEATGETIITYLNKYRINLAAIMLRESNTSISNIAQEVGFNDTAYFAKLFKKYMFHTPSSYRHHYLSLCHIHKDDEARFSSERLF